MRLVQRASDCERASNTGVRGSETLHTHRLTSALWRCYIDNTRRSRFFRRSAPTRVYGAGTAGLRPELVTICFPPSPVSHLPPALLVSSRAHSRTYQQNALLLTSPAAPCGSASLPPSPLATASQDTAPLAGVTGSLPHFARSFGCHAPFARGRALESQLATPVQYVFFQLPS